MQELIIAYSSRCTRKRAHAACTHAKLTADGCFECEQRTILANILPTKSEIWCNWVFIRENYKDSINGYLKTVQKNALIISADRLCLLFLYSISLKQYSAYNTLGACIDCMPKSACRAYSQHHHCMQYVNQRASMHEDENETSTHYTVHCLIQDYINVKYAAWHRRLNTKDYIHMNATIAERLRTHSITPSPLTISVTLLGIHASNHGLHAGAWMTGKHTIHKQAYSHGENKQPWRLYNITKDVL
jgi:hypothetical protein